MENQTEQTGLTILPYTGAPTQRKSFLGRLFSGDNGQERSEMQQLTHEHALARRAIELDADLIRHRRKARNFLAVTELEDLAATEVAKVLRCRELCDSVEDLFAHEPIMAEILKVRVRSIFHGRCETHGHHGNRNGRNRRDKR